MSVTRQSPAPTYGPCCAGCGCGISKYPGLFGRCRKCYRLLTGRQRIKVLASRSKRAEPWAPQNQHAWRLMREVMAGRKLSTGSPSGPSPRQSHSPRLTLRSFPPEPRDGGAGSFARTRSGQ